MCTNFLDDGSPLSEAEIESLLSEIEKKLEQLELCAKEGKGVLLRRLTRQAVQPIQVETSHTPDSILKLNVGGTEFLVSKDLIMSEDWMLSAMFSGRHQLQPRADGAFFIGNFNACNKTHPSQKETLLSSLTSSITYETKKVQLCRQGRKKKTR